MAKPVNVLFLCTGNSARSILAEALLNHLGAGRFTACSAGSFPTGRVNPHALALLERMGIPAGNARSKSWDEFAGPGATDIDIVITVCGNAAGEACPVWPGHPVSAHWGVEDPAAVTGDEATVAAAFRRACDVLAHRVRALLALPVAGLEPPALRQELDRIGRSLPPADG
jgi:arsenate reductase